MTITQTDLDNTLPGTHYSDNSISVPIIALKHTNVSLTDWAGSINSCISLKYINNTTLSIYTYKIYDNVDVDNYFTIIASM